MPTRKAQWKSDAQFNAGTPTFNDTEVFGTGDNARIQLAVDGSDSANVPFTTPSNYDFDSAKVKIVGGSASLKEQAGAAGQDDFPYTTPGNYDFDSAKIKVTGGKASLLNKEISGQHSWPYTDIGNYDIDPVASIDIISGKAQLHNQGSHTNADDVTYNTPGNYTYDPAKIESVDKGGGNYAFRLKGTGITPYAWWHLNEATGITAADSSGNGRDGTLVNMEVVDWVSGKLNNCLRFDGVNEQVNCGSVARFQRNEPFSVEAWVKTTSTGANVIVSNKVNNGQGWDYIISGGIVYWRLIYVYNSNMCAGYAAGVPINDGNWHHIVVTYDGSSDVSGMRIYIDGISRTVSIQKNNLITDLTYSSICSIGSLNGTHYFWNGDIDEVVIYDKVLDSTEVAFRYNAGVGTEIMPGGAIATDNPTVVQDFDAAFGTVLQWKDYIETALKPSGTDLKYIVSIDSGVTWKWWDGDSWETANGTYAQSNTEVEIDTNIYLLGVGNQHIRVTAFLHSDGANSPELDNVNIVWYDVLANYVLEGRITAKVGVDESPDTVWSWDAFAETVEEPVDTEVRYALSNDDGATWLYWSGAAWVTSNGYTWTQFSTGADVTANIGALTTANPKLNIRAFLKTTDSTKTPKLNNIQVNYQYGINYDTGSPTVDALFDIGPGVEPLVEWTDFLETVVTPALTTVKYTLSDDSGVTWYWWNGAAWVAANGTVGEANTATEIQANITTFPVGTKTLRVRAFLTTSDSTETPELDNIQIRWTETPITYPLTPQEITMNTDIQPATVGMWTDTTETVTKPVNTDIKYQYSIDSGGSWNGSWLTASELDAAIVDIVCDGGGTDKLRFKFQLTTTDVGVTPEIDNLKVDYGSSYKTTGIYTSTAYVPPGASTNGVYCEVITFEVITPSGTTLVIKARTVNNVLEESFVAYDSGNTIARCGSLIQFEATLTGDGLVTPKLNWCEIEFHTLIGIMRVMEAMIEALPPDLTLIKKVLTNRHTIVDNTLIIYDDDKVTPLYTYNLKDSGGTATPGVNIFDRDPA